MKQTAAVWQHNDLGRKSKVFHHKLYRNYHEQRWRKRIRMRMHTYARAQTDTRTHTHTHTHTYIYTYTHIYTYTCARIRTHASIEHNRRLNSDHRYLHEYIENDSRKRRDRNLHQEASVIGVSKLSEFGFVSSTKAQSEICDDNGGPSCIQADFVNE